MKKRQAKKFIRDFKLLVYTFPESPGFRKEQRLYRNSCRYLDRKKKRCVWKKIKAGMKRQFDNSAWQNLAIVKDTDYGDISKVPEEIINLNFRDMKCKTFNFNLDKDEKVKLLSAVYL